MSKIDNLLSNIHKAASMKQICKMQSQALEWQAYGYTLAMGGKGADFVSPAFDVSFPVSKEAAGRHITAMTAKLDELTEIFKEDV